MSMGAMDAAPWERHVVTSSRRRVVESCGQVSCRGTGGDHSTSEPVDAEDGHDMTRLQRGTNGEPTGNQRGEPTGTKWEPTGEPTGFWMILRHHEECMCLCEMSKSTAHVRQVFWQSHCSVEL